MAPPDTPAPAPPPKDDVEAAQRWLDALRDGNTRELQAYTAYPFELHEEGGCKLQHAASRERLAGAVACLSTDAELLDLLRRHEPSALQVLPDSARSMVDDLDVRAPLEQLVTGFFHRSDARADFVFWIADGGVRGVWKAGPRGTGEIGIATEWLEALRTRDLERLARVTSYPFELRDAGDDATCGKRVAKTREQLGKVIGCLFRSEPLQRALADSTLLAPERQAKSEPLSDWATPWWRAREHDTLRNVRASPMTEVHHWDIGFSIQMLEDEAGVRVFWKYGSRESNE